MSMRFFVLLATALSLAFAGPARSADIGADLGRYGDFEFNYPNTDDRPLPPLTSPMLVQQPEREALVEPPVAREMLTAEPENEMPAEEATAAAPLPAPTKSPARIPAPAVVQQDLSGAICDDGCPNACGNGCCGDFWHLGDCSPRLSVWAWGAPAYYSTGTGTSLWGFSEGVTGGYRLNEAVGLFVSANFLHTEEDTSVLGTVGVQRFGDPCGCDLADRLSVAVMWDQFAYTDVEDTYVHQFRSNLGIVTGDCQEVGVTFSVPTSGRRGDPAQTPLGGPMLLTLGNSFVGPYLKRDVGIVQFTGLVGYDDGSDSAAVGVGLARPICDRTNVFFDTKYGGEGAWALSAGVEVGFGRGDTRRY
jgi:hypothetical protein